MTRRSTRAARADARRVRWRQARLIRHGLHRQRVAMLRRVRGLAAAGGTSPADGDLDTLRTRVLGVIEAHPNGIGAREIGNELGIDWRSVTAVTGSLVARGAADQIEQDFYPIGKASRKC